MKDTQAELFQQIRTGSWDFLEEDWENVSPAAQELVRNLLVVDPEQRWTVKQALNCSWLKDFYIDKSINGDLVEIVDDLRERRARLRGAERFNKAVYWEGTGNDEQPIVAGLKAEDNDDSSVISLMVQD